MSGFLEWCERELEIAGLLNNDDDPDGIDNMIGSCIMQLCTVFDQQHHSGMSASYAAAVFNRLANYMPLTPLTGEEDEWYDVGCGGLENMEHIQQNNRCTSVFRDNKEGITYHADRFVFREPGGEMFTCRYSRYTIESFPYYPTTVVLDLPEEYTDEDMEKAVEAYLNDHRSSNNSKAESIPF